MKYHSKQVVIVGGGITGLAAAYYLHKESKQQNLPICLTLIEASCHLGGKIRTQRQDGYVIELGADSFLERKRYATDLAKELGLASELVNNEVGPAYIYQKGNLHPVPEGSVMGVPTKIEPFLKSELLSIAGKARGLEDLILKVGTLPQDLSVGDFFRRRFGNEMVDQLIEPLVSGVYGNPIDSLSLTATYPHYKHLLQKHGSLIKGLAQSNKHTTRPSKGMFQTLRSGLGTLVEKIEQALPKETVMKNNALKQLIRTADGYQLILKNGNMLKADAVIMTTPYPQTRKLLQPYLDVTSLDRTSPTSIATVAMGFHRQDVKLNYEGTGFIVPKQADFNITACTWVHKKWPHTTPANKALLRCFIGRADDDQLVFESDDRIVQSVLQDLKKIKGIQIKKSPEFVRIHRLKHSRPAYQVGHKQWVDKLYRQVQIALPNIYLAGAFYHGIGLPDCIEQGKTVAEKAIDSLQKTEPVELR